MGDTGAQAMSSKDMRRLTKSVETIITEDWRQQLDGLAVYRPRHLLRRVGPMLIGVCLNRDSGGEKYLPCFHVHFLGEEFPCVSLTMCTELRNPKGAPDYIQVQMHHQRYLEAASRLIQQALLPLKGPIHLDQIIEAYRKYAATPMGQLHTASLFGDCIMLLAICERQTAASNLLEKTLEELSDQQEFQSFGGRAEFQKKMRQAIEDPDNVWRTVDAQVDSLAVDTLPTDSLIY
jgi:hypothetical protein